METTYLKHHGILGQKWGVKNGPPYPLTGRTMSSSEKKAKKTGKRYVKVEPTELKRSASSMSDEELSKEVKRKGLESSYKKYQKEAKKAELSNLDQARQVAELARTSATTIEKAADDAFKEYHKYQKSQIDLSDISDEDLRKIVNRLNLEQQYRNLLPDDVSRGEMITKNALGIIAATSVTAVAALGAVYMIKSMM